jgi:hypothetical protein
MLTTPPLARPQPLDQLRPELVNAHQELADLAALAAAGLPVASLLVVPAAVEERFYRLNNLPALLNEVFARVDPDDPDEDEVEEACPAAETLVRQHYLLDEFVDAFYAAIAELPLQMCVRRILTDGEDAVRGRPALMALKHVYQRDWSYASVWDRLERRQGIALEARPVLLHGAEGTADGVDAGEALAARASEVLGTPVRLRLADGGGVVGVRRL